MYFLLKMGIFHCCVSLPEGNKLHFTSYWGDWWIDPGSPRKKVSLWDDSHIFRIPYYYTPTKANMDTKQLPCLKGPVTFSKAHHFGALQPLGPSGGVPTEFSPWFFGGKGANLTSIMFQMGWFNHQPVVSNLVTPFSRGYIPTMYRGEIAPFIGMK